MDITTRKGKTPNMQRARRDKNKWLMALTPLSLAVISHFSAAKGIDISASLEGTTMLQNRHNEARDEELLTYSVKPSLTALLNTKTFSGNFHGSVTQLNRDADDASRKDTFAEYQYGLSWQPIEHVLTFEANGAQKYLDNTGQDFLVSDYFLNADSLARVDTQNYSTHLTLPQGDLVAGNASVTYSIIDGKENAFNNTSALNNDTLVASFALSSGNDAENHFWMMQGNYNDIKRDESANGDYTGEYATAYIDSVLYKPWAVRFTATYDANELVDRNDEFSNDREFKSYGVGLTYRLSQQRYISITANTIDSDVERDDGETFIGVDAVWAITPRTNIQATYGKRFYGKSASASLNYASRKVRGVINYSEQVTSYSQLAASPQSLGVFVCPVGQFTIDACFQPSSLDYEPAEDEQILQIITTGLELSNAIILRKSAIAQIGLQGRRLILAFNAQYAEHDYLEFDRVRKNSYLEVDSRYKLSRHSNLLTTIRYGILDLETPETGKADNEQWVATLGLKRQFSQSLSGDVKLKYTSRSGKLNSGVFGLNWDERRIAFSLEYKFN